MKKLIALAFIVFSLTLSAQPQNNRGSATRPGGVSQSGRVTASRPSAQQPQPQPQPQHQHQYYDTHINPLTQIDEAVRLARRTGKNVICQVGGNWCRWCVMFADYIGRDPEISRIIRDNYVYIHVDYDKKKSTAYSLAKRLGNPARFGFPCLVVLNSEGKVIHLQDSALLEQGEGYSHEKVLRFFENWTPRAVRTVK